MPLWREIGILCFIIMAEVHTAASVKTYKPRHPEKTPFYSVVYHYYDKFKAVYEECFQKEYGRWRGVIDEVVSKYFQCGTYLGGFARLRCENCGAEKFLALTCTSYYTSS